MHERKKTMTRCLSAALCVLLLFVLLPSPASAANNTGLVVEKLTFRDVLRLYSADRSSFGTDALSVDEKGVANASRNLASMFAYTVGLNYNGSGKNADYFGKNITSQMGLAPYSEEQLLATYSVEIAPYRSAARALPEGKTTSIRVYLVGYVNAANGVEPVLHYVWEENGGWWAVKDDNPFYKVSYNGESALQTSGVSLVRSRVVRGGQNTLEGWTDLSAQETGVVQLRGSTLVAGEGRANVFGVTRDASSLAGDNSLSADLLAVSDFVRGDSGYKTGPLVHTRECYEDGTMHRIPDGERLRGGVTYRIRVVYDETLTVAKGAAGEDVALSVRSESSGSERAITDLTWYGSAEYLQSDRFNPHTVEFTFTPQPGENGVCTFTLENLVGSESGVKAASFHACASGGAGTAVKSAPAATAETTAEITASPTQAPTPAPTPVVTPAPTPIVTTKATSLPILTAAGSEAPLTRGMLAETLWILSGRPRVKSDVSFRDLPGDKAGRTAVLWAVKEGLIRADGDFFGTDQPVTREQAAVVLFRYAQLRGADTAAAGDLSRWPDGGSVSAWAREGVQWALGSGVLNALPEGTLALSGVARCGDVTGMIFRMEQLY